MSCKVIKFKHQLKPFFHYFQKRHLINRPDSLGLQWSRQVIITIFRWTWKTKNKTMESPPIFFCCGVIGHRKGLWSLKTKFGFGSTFTSREGICTPTMPVKLVHLNQVLFLKVSLKWFQNMTFRINYLENFIHLSILIYFFVGQYVKILIDPSH